MSLRKVNTRDIPEDAWASPNGRFKGSSKSVSVALGRDNDSTDLMLRHPFDLEILRIAPGCTPYPFHSHAAQWEFYQVVAGRGVVRHADGTTPIEPGDAFLFTPGEAHTFTNDGSEDLVINVIADNPINEPTYYPDSEKWIVRSPERRVIRSEQLDYFDGEE